MAGYGPGMDDPLSSLSNFTKGMVNDPRRRAGQQPLVQAAMELPAAPQRKGNVISEQQLKGQIANPSQSVVPANLATSNATPGGEMPTMETPGQSSAPSGPSGPDAVTMAYRNAEIVPGGIAQYIPGGERARQIPGEVSDAYDKGGIGAGIGAAARGGVASIGSVFGDVYDRVVRPPGIALAQAVKTAVTGDASPITGPAGGPAAQASSGASRSPNWEPGGNGAPVATNASTVADATVGKTVAPTDPSIGRSDYQPMTTEQANAYYGAQNRALDAKAEADRRADFDARTEAMRANSEWAQAWGANDAAQKRAQWAEMSGNRAQIGGARAALAARADANETERMLMGAGRTNSIKRDPLADLATMQDTVNKERMASAALSRGRVMDPLLAQAERQKVALGANSLAQQAAEQKVIAEIQNADTPEKRDAATQKLLAMRGQQTKVVIVDADTGQVDPMGNPVYKKVAVNPLTGEFLMPPGTMKGDASIAPPNHISALKANPTPEMKKNFDAKYGAGSADKTLGK